MNRGTLTPLDTMPDITITKWDLGRLDSMIGIHAPIRSWRAVEFLVRELMRANIVGESQIPASLVTMRSRVEYRDEASGTNKVVTLVYPGESDLYDDGLSILTPVAATLLGLSEGQSMSYPAPDGTLETITVVKVLYQPEASRQARV